MHGLTPFASRYQAYGHGAPQTTTPPVTITDLPSSRYVSMSLQSDEFRSCAGSGNIEGQTLLGVNRGSLNGSIH
ncbi:MAG: hypothetical protein B7X48_09930 [Acidiphilium sp. 34-60-192]|nr:MAG: hypothetical protein B7X48_09930 [Acidiphilium sp. 34-60-192]